MSIARYTPDMFGKARAKPRVLMHAVDTGYDGASPIGHFTCDRCGHDAGWWTVENDTELRRGIPCPNCNEQQPADLGARGGETK